MLPGVYEFRWDAAHLVFLGAFYLVAAALVLTLIVVWIRARGDLQEGREEEIRWKEDFRQLPAARRVCRHEIAGRVRRRTCPNAFDCRHCPDFARLALRGSEGDAGLRAGNPPAAELPADLAAVPLPAAPTAAPRLDMPEDRLYHRGHTWVRREEDGSCTVGLDELACRILGAAERVAVPGAGSRVRVNGTAWRMRWEGCEVRILSPVDGVVVENDGSGKAWTLKVRPEGGRLDDRHLLRGPEVDRWIEWELEKLQELTGTAKLGASPADGGMPIEELHRAIPAGRRDEILGEIFLEP
jgi:glycine cleavage system H lipoate-binding protein